MIIWITGNSGSGKTTLAKQMKTPKTVILDGDDVRNCWATGFIKKQRWEHNLSIAFLARILESQGFDVIVAVICPYKKLRDEVQAITKCSFIYLKTKAKSKDHPYEYEKDKFYLGFN